MAYRRRYFAALTITTTAYGEKSVTTDKLADKAVTTPKIADDAITTDQIVDETIKSEDIKAGEVKTSDIGSGAVTTEKIADQAVTVAKLEASIQGIARPLTPGVATAEIADLAVTEGKLAANSVATGKIKDGNVNAAKLAVDAVETAKIKDGAVSTAKIAGGAIDATKIAVDAVTGSEILNGSVGYTELAADSVRTVKVLDANITLDKLAPNSVDSSKIVADGVGASDLNIAALARRHMNSLAARESIFLENFGGHEISDRWVKSGDAGGLVVPAGVDGVRIQTGPLLHDTQQITFGGNPIVIPNVEGPSIMFMLTGTSAPVELVRMWLGFRVDATHYIAFAILDVGPNNMRLFAQTRDGGATESNDTGIDLIDGTQLFEIDISDPASIKFYIDGALVATNTTNIPTAGLLEPWFYLDTGEALLKYIDLKFVNIIGTRPL